MLPLGAEELGSAVARDYRAGSKGGRVRRRRGCPKIRPEARLGVARSSRLGTRGSPSTRSSGKRSQLAAISLRRPRAREPAPEQGFRLVRDVRAKSGKSWCPRFESGSRHLGNPWKSLVYGFPDRVQPRSDWVPGGRVVPGLKGPAFAPSACASREPRRASTGRTPRPSHSRSSPPPRGRVDPASEGAVFPPRRAIRVRESQTPGGPDSVRLQVVC